jgi:hypothetical protein
MKMRLHGFDEQTLTWSVDMLDSRDNVLDVYNDVSIRILESPIQLDISPTDIAHLQYNGIRRSIYGYTNDVDDLIMDDWEIAMLFKALEVT